MANKKALLLVDVQKDFLPGGSLAAPGGDAILPPIRRLMGMDFDRIVATRDWHPADHVSFASMHGREVGDVIDINGIVQRLWPVHCVQGEEGADFADGIDSSRFDCVFDKGVDSSIDSYSAFYDNKKLRSTGLTDYLRGEEIEQLVVVGLVTEVCVHDSVIDAVRDGFSVTVVLDGCGDLALEEGDVERALASMRAAGAEVVTLDEYLRSA